MITPEYQQDGKERLRYKTAVVKPEVDELAAPTNSWIPFRPWPKQQAFLDLTCREALYGGAAGGGKSQALLMAALQYVHVPGYAALILRRDTQRLSLAGGLIPRAHEWLANKGAIWNGALRRWTFPTGAEPATLTFGYVQAERDKYRYGSSEFQFIAFDELTEFPEDDYLYLFSRLRRRRGIPVPLRVRSATNPGGLGHLWVRSRFIHADYLGSGNVDKPLPDVIWQQDLAYVPARIGDNPALIEEEYRQTLVHLQPVARERLMNGDWTIQEQGLMQADWLRYYQVTDPLGAANSPDEVLHLLSTTGEIVLSIPARACRRFVTIDPAGTSEDRARELKGRPPSWTVAQVWDQPRGAHAHLLLLREQVRERMGFKGLEALIRKLHCDWQPAQILIENEKFGMAAVDMLQSVLPIRCIPTLSRDKVTRAARLFDKLQRGEVFLPKHNLDWRPAFEAEFLAWTGDPREVSDQIDAAAYAAIFAAQQISAPVQLSTLTLPLVRGDGTPGLSASMVNSW